jgi:colanic acid biosynthesis glycosyl transferase WcaI
VQELNKVDSLRVAYVTQWFAPEPSGPPLWIAQALQSHGIEVRVITAVPNYPKGVVYPGYSAIGSTREIIDGIDATRCPVYPSHDRSALRRAINYTSFAISASWIGRKILKSADVALVYSSPETAAIPALIAHHLNRVPYVLLVQDLWPDSVLQTGFLESNAARGVARWSLGFLDQTVCKRAAHIVVTAPGMKAALVSRRVPEEKITVMFNWVDESVVFPQTGSGMLRSRLGVPAGALLFAFAGNLGTAQGLSAWLLAIQASQDLTDLYFVFLGEGAEKSQLQSKADLLGLKRTFFIDPVELSEYVHLAAEIDAQIISLTNSPLFHMTIPGKLQSCLALGKAIVASVAGDSARIIVDSGAGLVAAPGNSAEIEKIIRLAHREGQAALAARGSLGRSYYLDHMGSRTSSALLVDVLRSAAISGLKGPR